MSIYVYKDGTIFSVIIFNTLHSHIESEKKIRHFADNVFKIIFLNENGWILIYISLKYVSNDQIKNKPELVQIIISRLWLV